MKKSYLLVSALTVGLLFSTTSCKDVLEEVPVSQVGAQYINSAAGFEAAGRAAYSTLRDFYGREIGMNLTVFGTDTYTMGADGSYKFMNQYLSQFDGRVDILRDLWNNFYVGINTMNIVIDNAATVTGLDANLVKRRVAEMKFLRAHHYFVLVQTFGGVALITKGNLEPTKAFNRASVKDAYALITSDLESAIPDLGTPTSDYGRATKGAAEHLLARVYLTKATSEAAAADDYAKAATYATNVIKNYSYALLPDFASVFAQGGGEINSEVIFATQYTSDALTNIGVAGGAVVNGNQTHLYFGMEYDTQAGMQRDVLGGRPFKRYRPTTYMLETVFAQANRVNDSRYKKTFKDTWLSNRPGTYTNMFDDSKTSATFAAGDTTIFIPGFEMSKAERAKRKYQVLVPSNYRPNLFPTLQKFLDPLRPDRTYEAGSRDFLMFRLAETYLILGEAQFRLGKLTEAAEAINVVRRRAAWPGRQTQMEITPAQLSIDFILDERDRELAGEMFRWFDLKRTGKLIERVKAHNPDGGPNIKDFHVLRPIPQDQIDRTTNGATAFPQNPGY
ncbi:RagB/SusD family nutrient uptake outer membrane protein [Spirosoma sordidisoli]|uniref:RagB/SusD family nutrient uptake outer membrane protein n=1 Tax=Spirosoma sordidisoli TaxID=2502893 RepID=A0A4Q2UNB8_9BACT|nr:RagB/SusD family nutrient uptake outer membrane protein [Spirosoma sordidisoli]RYC71177.1 RagB/SusD family nutrient uptake outer membrane protein [Spirosoma sordidisoli]